jgi:hypothetical protein
MMYRHAKSAFALIVALAVVGTFVAASGQARVNAQHAPKQSGGALAASNYQCAGFSIGPGVPLTFSSDGVSFGSGISTTGTQFNSFILQQGIYQIHLSGHGFAPQLGLVNFDIMANLNNVATTSWRVTQGTNDGYLIIGGDRLVSVAGANTTLQFSFTEGGSNTTNITNGPCSLIITRLQ